MTMKHLFSLSLLLLALLLPATAPAHDFYVNGIYYNINGNEATVTYKGDSFNQYSNEYSGSVSIPSTVTYSGTTYSVTSIGDNAFYGCRSLTSVTIPNPIASIGYNPFSVCSGLTSIVVESGNPTYDSRNNCNAIIETASNTLIVGCQNTIIPYSVTAIGNYAFYWCTGLTSINIPNSVISIGEYAFEGCSGLASVSIPNSVRTISDVAFLHCSGLTSISVAAGNTTYDSRNNCNAIIITSTNTLIICCKNTVIPNSVTSIGSGAFWDCWGLTNIDIPNCVVDIGDDAFLGCRDLASITIPNSVTSIGNNPFIGCSSLTSIVVAGDNSTYDSRNNCNAIIETASNTLITGCKNTVVPNSVTSIGDAAFDGCNGLTSINIPNSVTSIGNSAFYYCSGLTSIDITI